MSLPKTKAYSASKTSWLVLTSEINIRSLKPCPSICIGFPLLNLASFIKPGVWWDLLRGTGSHRNRGILHGTIPFTLCTLQIDKKPKYKVSAMIIIHLIGYKSRGRRGRGDKILTMLINLISVISGGRHCVNFGRVVDLQLFETLKDILCEFAAILKANGDPDHTVGYAKCLSVISRHRSVSHNAPKIERDIY